MEFKKARLKALEVLEKMDKVYSRLSTGFILHGTGLNYKSFPLDSFDCDFLIVPKGCKIITQEEFETYRDLFQGGEMETQERQSLNEVMPKKYQVLVGGKVVHEGSYFQNAESEFLKHDESVVQLLEDGKVIREK